MGRSATIDTGAGDDGTFIDAMQVRGKLFVRLGAGDDTLEIRNTAAFAAFLYGVADPTRSRLTPRRVPPTAG